MAKLYTARIYDSLKIRKAMPDAKQVCIQRRPWRYIRKDAEVIRFTALGPPVDLHKDTQEFLKRAEKWGVLESETLTFQTRYAAKYLSYIIIGIDDDGPPDGEIAEIRSFLCENGDVILECSCAVGQFCHRLLLYHLLIDWLGLEFAGGELELKEEK